MTKDEAIEILNALDTEKWTASAYSLCRTLIEALAAAGAFTDGAYAGAVATVLEYADESELVPDSEIPPRVDCPKCGKPMKLETPAHGLHCASCCGDYLQCDTCPRRESAPFAPGDRCPMCRGKLHEIASGQPSRPVANGASEPHPGWVSLCTGEPVRHSSESRPVAVGSKARAEEILNDVPTDMADERAFKLAIEALDRAQFFADTATLAEIDHCVSEIEKLGAARLQDRARPHREYILAWAVRLATEVRKLGIGDAK
jgi:ssDNA-binding Zn-finger/Zn-ribbon topoisomerase 1